MAAARFRAATIEGGDGVATAGGAATVKNFGTILATGAAGIGVTMSAGALTNGSRNNAGALIEGYTGALLSGTATSSNFGTISGVGDTGGFGVRLGGTESLINGAAGHVKATIDGYGGVYAAGTANTVTNFGDISGAGGTALAFTSSLDTLIVEAGCSFEGAVVGGGGELILDTGSGTLSGLATGISNVTVSGSMAATTFTGFSTLVVSAGATFTDTGAVTLTAGQTVNSAGSLTLGGSGKSSIVNAGLIETTGVGTLVLAGAVTNTGTIEAAGGTMTVTTPLSGAGTLAAAGGTLTVTGAVTGTGVATINGGVLDFTSTFKENVTFTGTTGELELAQSQTYTGSITGFSKTGGTSLDLVDIGFVSSGEATYSGTTKSGVLTVTDGTHTAHIALKGNYLTSTFVASSDGHGGVIVVDPKAKAPAIAPSHQFIAAMAGWATSAAGPAEARAAEVHPPPILLAPRTQWT